MKNRLLLGIVLLVLACSAAHAAAPIWVMRIDGQIDPPTASYIRSGLKNADEDGAQAVLIIMDTPGGLMTSMQEIIKALFASEVPTIVYVAPNGATAASAGTFITMAADIAAMAPVSNIGSASPVNVSPSSGKGEEISPTMKRKVENFAVEYARSIAQRRGRNSEWAEKAVRGAANITATKALELKVIDYVAESNEELLKKIDGRKIKLATGKTVTLDTKKAPLKQVPMGSWETFLHYLSNPAVVLFLSLAAMYGIIYELSNPGLIFPGVVGAISVLLLLYSYSVLPVSAAGFAFLALAMLLFVADLFTPTHGILTVGGVISLFLGLMMLFRSAEGFMLSIWTIILVTLMTAGFFAFVVGLGLKAMRRPYVSGREGVVGHVGETKTDLNPKGEIFVDGALWKATSESGDIATGEQVEVIAMDGLKLRVRKHTPL
jgi:membrane-bound serine protease (ClpP class)